MNSSSIKSPMQSTVCSESAARCLSKSYMALAVTVFTVEITGNILIHGSVERQEAGIIARMAQAIDTRLREVLILRADRFGHVNIFDIFRQAQRLEHGVDHVAEAFCFAGTHVEDAIYARCLQQPAQDRNCIVHINKIAALIAIRNTFTVRFE